MNKIDRLIEIDNRMDMTSDSVVLPIEDYEWLTDQIRPNASAVGILSDEEASMMINNNLKYDTVKDRIKNLGWNRHDALTYPTHYRSKNQKWYDKARRELGLSEISVRNRVNKGWTYEEAATTPKYQNPERLKDV